MTPILAIGITPGMIVIVLLAGVLLFGRKLPEVGSQLGKGLAEFKRSLNGIENPIETPLPTPTPAPQRVTAVQPKFPEA